VPSSFFVVLLLGDVLLFGVGFGSVHVANYDVINVRSQGKP